MTMQRQRAKHTASLRERLAQLAKAAKERASSLPPGADRDLLFRKAMEAERAVQIEEWLASASRTRLTA